MRHNYVLNKKKTKSRTLATNGDIDMGQPDRSLTAVESTTQCNHIRSPFASLLQSNTLLPYKRKAMKIFLK